MSSSDLYFFRDLLNDGPSIDTPNRSEHQSMVRLVFSVTDMSGFDRPRAMKWATEACSHTLIGGDRR